MNGQLVSDEALRCVVTALLLRVWSCARAVGKFDGDDLSLGDIGLADIDSMAGVQGFADAMVEVGWLTYSEAQGVVLPRFGDNNAPMTGAEKQSAYRRRLRDQSLPQHGNAALRKVTPREEKRREEKNKKEERVPLSPAATPSRLLGVVDLPPVPPEIDSEQTRAAWGEFVAMRNRMAKAKRMTVSAASAIFRKLIPFGPVIAASALNDAVAGCYQGVFPEKFNGANQNGHGKQSVIDGRRAEKSAREFPDDAQLPIAR